MYVQMKSMHQAIRTVTVRYIRPRCMFSLFFFYLDLFFTCQKIAVTSNPSYWHYDYSISTAFSICYLPLSDGRMPRVASI